MIDLADFRSILSLIHDEILLISVENRGGKAQVFVGEIKEAIERAIKAEAEAERLQTLLETFNSKCAVCEPVSEITKLQTENAKLRAATTELLEVVEILHPNMNPDEPCVVYEAWEQSKQALAELDEEGER